MNTTRRLAPAAVALLAIAGCRGPLGPEMRGDRGVQLSFENASDTQVTIHPVLVPRQRDESGAFTGPSLGAGSTIERGGTLRYQIVTSPSDMDGRVLRIRVERLAPSWEEPGQQWFEVVGRIPEQIRVVSRTTKALDMVADGAKIVEVPSQFVHSPASREK